MTSAGRVAPPTIVQHDSALGRWERATRAPHPRLRGLVGSYHGYRQRLEAPLVHRGLPSPLLPLVVSFGPPQTVQTADGRATGGLGSFVAGLHDRHVLITAEEYHGLQVDLDPVGAHVLLGMPLRDLVDRSVPLAEVLGPDADRLVDDLATAPDWPSRFARLDAALLARLDVGRAPRVEVARAWARVRSAAGGVRIQALADELGWTQRHLAKQFVQAFGLPPKRLARLARVERAVARLTGPVHLATVASELGYADQAHLSNEVRRFTGLTPTELLALRLPDDGGVFDRPDT